MKNPRIEATWKDLARIRVEVPQMVTPLDVPFFIPAQPQAPAFENCCTNNRCHKCK